MHAEQVTDAAKAFKKIHPLEYSRSFLREGVRPNDGRPMHAYRPISLSQHSLSKCDASAMVKMGQTSVLCGVKSEVAVLSDLSTTTNDVNVDRNGEGGGVVIVQVRVPSMCSERMAASGSFALREKRQQELTAMVNDVVQRCMNTEKLVIHAEQGIAWVLYVDAYVLEDDGNLEDICLFAVQAVLHDLKMPHVEFDEELQEVRMVVDESKQGRERFSYVNVDLLTRFALSSTFVQVEIEPDVERYVILTDPTGDEESICSSKFTVVYDDQGILMQSIKSHGNNMSEMEMREMMQRAKQRTIALKRKIQSLDANKKE